MNCMHSSIRPFPHAVKPPMQRKRRRIQDISSDEEDAGISFNSVSFPTANSAVSIAKTIHSNTVCYLCSEADRGTQEDKPEPLPVKRRKRVKKLKSKMYTTEDGAMGECNNNIPCD